MDILTLLDELDSLIHRSKPVPFTDQVRVDKEEIYDLLDRMRATIPEEIKQARWIVENREEILAAARAQAGEGSSGAAEASPPDPGLQTELPEIDLGLPGVDEQQ